MAAAVMGGNVLALLFTVVFARRLGQTGYGSLSALISSYIILMVPGSAVQTTVAREVSAAVAAGDPAAGAGVWRWLERLGGGTLLACAGSLLGRPAPAGGVGVGGVPPAAAGPPPRRRPWLVGA